MIAVIRNVLAWFKSLAISPEMPFYNGTAIIEPDLSQVKLTDAEWEKLRQLIDELED